MKKYPIMISDFKFMGLESLKFQGVPIVRLRSFQHSHITVPSILKMVFLISSCSLSSLQFSSGYGASGLIAINSHDINYTTGASGSLCKVNI